MKKTPTMSSRAERRICFLFVFTEKQPAAAGLAALRMTGAFFLISLLVCEA